MRRSSTGSGTLAFSFLQIKIAGEQIRYDTGAGDTKLFYKDYSRLQTLSLLSSEKVGGATRMATSGQGICIAVSYPSTLQSISMTMYVRMPVGSRPLIILLVGSRPLIILLVGSRPLIPA